LFITVVCDCGHQFEMPEGNAGLFASCPVCARVLVVPKAATVSASAMTSDAELFVIAAEPTHTSGKAIISFVLGLGFVFACLSGFPAIIIGNEALNDINRSGGRLGGRKLAKAGIKLGYFGCLFTLALFMAHAMEVRRSAREAAKRSWCANNLKQIGLAFHNYHAVQESLPPAAILDKNGKPLLSWRVALLPYLESSDLYAKFHLDEPWDSPHNLTLLEAMPNFYRCPNDVTLELGMTGYQAVIGPSTAFTPDFKPLRFADITDGTSNTILVGESKRAVPWTKPEDLPFDMSVPLTGLGSPHAGGFNVLFADGSVRFLKGSITTQALRALVTRNGSEGFRDDDQY
jgi:prepilin-type processing-associated H-X9-DG protein